MPWCEECSRFYTPTSMNRDGTCPTCGTSIAAPVRTPWHFKLLLASVVLYLGWRTVQLAQWVAGRF